MKKLLILSGKGGTGKTTVAAAFIDLLNASAFADCDVDAPNLHLVTGVHGTPQRTDYYGSPKARIDPDKCIGCGACALKCRFDAISQADRQYTVDEYACEGCGVCQFVCPMSAVEMTDDVAGELALYQDMYTFSTAKLKMGRGNSGKLVTEVKNALHTAEKDAEFAIIDGSPGIGCPVIASMSGVDWVLIVAEPSLSGISDMERLAETALALDVRIAVCVNKYDVSEECTLAIKRYCEKNGIPFIGRIPYDPRASEAINNGRSLAREDCPASIAIQKICHDTLKLLGGDTPLC